jgi:hypothetical protein
LLTAKSKRARKKNGDFGPRKGTKDAQKGAKFFNHGLTPMNLTRLAPQPQGMAARELKERKKWERNFLPRNTPNTRKRRDKKVSFLTANRHELTRISQRLENFDLTAKNSKSAKTEAALFVFFVFCRGKIFAKKQTFT